MSPRRRETTSSTLCALPRPVKPAYIQKPTAQPCRVPPHYRGVCRGRRATVCRLLSPPLAAIPQGQGTGRFRSARSGHDAQLSLFQQRLARHRPRRSAVAARSRALLVRHLHGLGVSRTGHFRFHSRADPEAWRRGCQSCVARTTFKTWLPCSAALPPECWAWGRGTSPAR